MYMFILDIIILVYVVYISNRVRDILSMLGYGDGHDDNDNDIDDDD